jgi:hypothetical protein
MKFAFNSQNKKIPINTILYYFYSVLCFKLSQANDIWQMMSICGEFSFPLLLLNYQCPIRVWILQLMLWFVRIDKRISLSFTSPMLYLLKRKAYKFDKVYVKRKIVPGRSCFCYFVWHLHWSSSLTTGGALTTKFDNSWNSLVSPIANAFL